MSHCEVHVKTYRERKVNRRKEGRCISCGVELLEEDKGKHVECESCRAKLRNIR